MTLVRLYKFVSFLLLFSFHSSFELGKKKCLITTSNNFSIVSKVEALVDKTLLIKAIVNEGHFHIITAPRTFGKTTNLNMLQSFLSIPVNEEGNRLNPNNTALYKLFKEMLLYQRDPEFFYKYFGQFPVLHLDLATPDPITTFAQALHTVKYKIHEAFKKHSYLCYSERLDLNEKKTFSSWLNKDFNKTGSDGLVILAKFLFKHFDDRKVFVIVDEYDTLVTAGTFMAKDEDLSCIVKLISYQLEKLMTCPYVGRAVIAGVSSLPSASITKPKNIIRCRFLGSHPLVNYFGFTIDEVEDLFGKDVFNLDSKEIKNSTLMYGGFASVSGSTLFSAGSVIQFLWKGKAEVFWPPSIYVEHVMNAYNQRAVEQVIDQLIKDKSVPISFQNKITFQDFLNLRESFSKYVNYDLKPNTDLLLFHLMELGYLTVDTTRSFEPRTFYLRLPNHEMKQTLLEYIWNIQVFSKLDM